MALAKDALALLMLHEELDRLHRECIELIGEAWDIPAEEQREPLALLEEEQVSLRTGEGYAWTHMASTVGITIAQSMGLLAIPR